MTSNPESVRSILARVRRAIRAAEPGRACVCGDYEMGGGLWLAVYDAPAAGGGTLIGCYRYRIEREGLPVSPLRKV